jgi:hypothetical protein
MNGDGYGELAMGAPYVTASGARLAGAVYLAPGPLPEGQNDVETMAWTRYGDRGGLRLGENLAAVGDLDGDGRGDLVVAMPGFTDPEQGLAVGAFTVWWGSQLH